VLRSRGAKLNERGGPLSKIFCCLTADPTGICERRSTRVHARQFCDTLAQPITCASKSQHSGLTGLAGWLPNLTCVCVCV
jgi:hypothetical protein